MSLHNRLTQLEKQHATDADAESVLSYEDMRASICQKLFGQDTVPPMSDESREVLWQFVKQEIQRRADDERTRSKTK